MFVLHKNIWNCPTRFWAEFGRSFSRSKRRQKGTTRARRPGVAGGAGTASLPPSSSPPFSAELPSPFLSRPPQTLLPTLNRPANHRPLPQLASASPPIAQQSRRPAELGRLGLYPSRPPAPLLESLDEITEFLLGVCIGRSCP
jgi:hypothetical protein